MKVRFWGTRGSIAKAGRSTVRYGGNTSCVEVTTDAGTSIVIDCGTGAHGLGIDLLERSGGAPVDGHLLISHTHWDHIQGLPFFAPLFQPGSSWNIYGPRGLGGSILETLAGQMQYSYFPISLEQLAAQVEYHDLVDGGFDLAEASVVTHYLNHPALSLGYRIEVDGASVVYASDHEPYDPRFGRGGDLMGNRQERDHVRFFEGADLLIHDAQYVADEYAEKSGWGHSPVEYVVDAACLAEVGRLALFHHDPTRDDDALDAVVEMARARAAGAGFDGEVFAAAEDMVVEVVGSRSRPASAPVGRAAARRRPALDDVARSVLIAVGTPEIATIVREAAEAEGLQIWESSTIEESLDLARANQPSIVVLEDDDEMLDLAVKIRAIDPTYGSDVSIVTVTGSGRPRRTDQQSTSDWLPWPFSAVYARTRMHASLLRRACRWQAAPRGADEDRRLRALRDLEILDTESEPRFDQYTNLASDLLDVPIALVSLVDADRQWFKSHVGLDASETPRDMSFCAHAILGDDVFQIPDALEDDRFADNPLVTGDPRIRFYAGVPLELSDGSPVGTLCVIDYRPRLLDDEQMEALRVLGDQVVDELEATAPDSD